MNPETTSMAAGLRRFAAMVGLFVLVAGLLFSVASGRAQAAPPAGTVIGNQATATYNDAGGNPRTATSNLVTTTVTQVKSFTLTADGNRTAAAGQTVFYAHTVTNTGNGTDTYALNPLATGGGFAHTALAYYVDADGNGVPDNLTPIATTGALAMGGVFRFVVAGTVPGGATNGQTGTITVSVTDTATPTANTVTNLDTTTVANSAITVTKALSVTTGPSPNAGPITVTLSYANSGSASATNLSLTDNLPAGFTYIAGSGRWSVSGATVLGDGAGGDPAGINYAFTAGQVTATVATVAAGASGNVTFAVQVAAGLAPGFINNTAQYLTTTQGSTNTNTASYQVVQSANVVANGSTTLSTNGTAEPVTIASAGAGATLSFQNVIWNTGNGGDSFDIAMSFPGGPWPAGTTFTLLQQDNATTLIDTNGNGTPDTGNIPQSAAGCGATFVVDAANNRCGYRVFLRVQLPVSAAGGPYTVRKTATSRFDNTRSEGVDDTVTSVAANTVDLTNNSALPTTPANGAGATGTTVITTNIVTPSAVATVTRFRLFVNNAGVIADSYDLAVAGTPAGWTVAFRADGGAGDCSTVGAALANTGAIAAAANRLVCAEVTVPAIASGQAGPGTFNLDFTATSALNAAVVDAKRDAVTVNAVHVVTLTPNNAQVTLAGGTVTYTHQIANTGNVAETISFTPGFLADSRAAQGWTSTAYLDEGNGLYDGTEPAITTATPFALALNATRTIFVRVAAPAGAAAIDPPNVTTLIARYNAGASSTLATDSTTVTDGLQLSKRQRTINCDGTAPGVFTAAPIPASPATAAGMCLQYQLVATNTTAAGINAVVLTDTIPANTRQRNGCGAPAMAPAGVVTSPGDGNAGTITWALPGAGTLAPAATLTATFCVRID